MSSISFGVVVVTYNRKELLQRSIQSILNQTYPVNKIVVVDNNSSDGTEEMLYQSGYLKLPNLYYVKLSENIGGSGGFCEGLKLMMNDPTIDWIALSDDDFEYDKDFFLHIASGISKLGTKDIVAFTGTVFEGEEIGYWHRRRLLDKIFFKQVLIPPEEYGQEFFIFDLLSFVGAVVKREVIEKVGLPDERYFIYYDDTEFSIRLRRLGNIVNYNKATGKHLVGSRNKNISLWRKYYEMRNFVHMCLKHSQNKPVTLIYLTFKLMKNILPVLIKARYKGLRRELTSTYLNAFFDGVLCRLGKNKKFLPD